MIRDSLGPTSRFMQIAFCEQFGIQSYYRLQSNSAIVVVTHTSVGRTLPVWLKLIRTGNLRVITAGGSTFTCGDGTGRPAAIRFAERARRFWRDGDQEKACEALIRAQDIVNQILSGLNPEVDRDLTGKVASVYIFVDEFFPKDARSSAQGLFNVMILGLGALLANSICPYLIQRVFTGVRDHDQVVVVSGDGAANGIGLQATLAAIHRGLDFYYLCYDNESYANTDIQLSGSTPWGANTTFSTPGSVKRIMHHRWKKNMAGLMAVGHPTCRYVATVCMSYGLHGMNSIRKALTIGGPTFIHSLDPCPKGWDYDPIQSHELGELAVQTGIWPLYEVEDGKLRLTGRTQQIADGKIPRKPVRDYLLRQGRFAHFTQDDLDYFQSKIDQMWTKWLIPGVIPFEKDLAASSGGNSAGRWVALGIVSP